MTLHDVQVAVMAVEARGEMASERRILSELGQGSRRDVAKFLRMLAEDGYAPGVVPGHLLPPATRQEVSEDAEPYEPGGVPEPDEGPEDEDGGAWEDAEDSGDDQPPSPRTVTPWDRRTTVSEVCELCGTTVSHLEMVTTVLSCLPSAFHIEYACTPLKQYWHDPCLRQYAAHWCLNVKQKEMRA